MMNENFEIDVETKGLDEMNEGLEMAKNKAVKQGRATKVSQRRKAK